jgi:hypothetical protein
MLGFDALGKLPLTVPQAGDATPRTTDAGCPPISDTGEAGGGGLTPSRGVHAGLVVAPEDTGSAPRVHIHGP